MKYFSKLNRRTTYLAIVGLMLFGFAVAAQSLGAVLSERSTVNADAFQPEAAVCPNGQSSTASDVNYESSSCAEPNLTYPTPTIPVESGGNVVYYDGYYYAPVKSGTEAQIRMVKAKHLNDLQALQNQASIKAQPVVWSAAGTPARGFINWPVAMYRLQDKWYIYMNAAASNPPNFTDRLYVIEADTDDPMGSWTYKGQVGQDTWTIGFCPIEWNGKLYMIVSNRENHTAGTYHSLAIAPMRNPWTTTGNWLPLTDPTYAWEKWSADGPNTAPINEVDQPLYHNGKLHVLFSASHVNSTNYATGVLTYKGTGSLLDRANWSKKPTPILSRTAAVAGPGQTFTFQSANGTDYIGYAHWKTPTVQSPRPVTITPVSWDSNGLPYVNVPAPGAHLPEPR